MSLKLLHADKRWKPLIAVVKQHKEKLYPIMDLTLAEQLDSVYASDQKYRLQIDEVAAKHGWDSKELKNLWAEIKIADSLNLIKVKKVLDTHGWLGEQVVGSTGNHALFLVIQHADTKTQEKYLPTLQEGVKKGNAKGSQLALLTDRIAVFNGRKQIYGSQIRQDPDTHTYTISPLEDPDRVDERRTKVGLVP